MKRFLTILLSFVSLIEVFGQAYGNFNQLRFLQITKASDTAQVAANKGRVWYDFVSNKYRANVNGVNVTIAPAPAGGVVGAENGLSLDGSDVILGGPLDRSTNITAPNGEELQIDGTYSGGSEAFLFQMSELGFLLPIPSLELASFPSTTTSTIPGISLSGFDLNMGIFDINSNVFVTGYGITTSSADVITADFYGRHFFNPTTTDGGLNWGAPVSGDPSSPVNNDTWGNVTTGTFRGRVGGSTGTFPFTTYAATYNAGAKQTFTPDATNAGINIGTIASDPLSLANGDLWINTTGGNSIKIRLGGSTALIPWFTSIANTQIPFANGTTGRMSLSANFVFDLSTNTLTVPRAVHSPTGTLASLNLGSIGANPSSLTNFDLWGNSATSSINVRLSGNSFALVNTQTTQTNTGVPYFVGTSTGQIGSEAAFTYNATTDALSVGTLVLDDNTLFGTGSTLLLDAVGQEIRSVARHSFTPDANNAGINVGSFAGNPTPVVDGDIWNNTLTGQLMARINGVSVALGGGSAAGANTQIQYNNSGAFGAESSFIYDAALNRVGLSSTSGNGVTSIFGGEIQLDDISGSDDVTINNSGIQVSGVANYDIVNTSGTISIDGVTMVVGTVTYDFPNVSGGNSAQLAFAFSGVTDGDVCMVTAPASVESSIGGCYTFRLFVSAADQLTISFDNCASLDGDPPSGTYTFVVFKN